MAKTFNKRVFLIKTICIVVLAVLCGVSCIFASPIERLLGIGGKESGLVSSVSELDNGLSVHYLDVGQGDCTLIRLPDGKNAVIDAGTSDSADHILSYIQQLGISTIDYFILTHADADHCGGAAALIGSADIAVRSIYRPFQISVKDDKANPLVATEYEDLEACLTDGTYAGKLNIADNKYYANFLRAAYTESYVVNGQEFDARVTVHYDGLKIEGTDYNLEFFAPLLGENTALPQCHTGGYATKYYSTSNNASPVILLESMNSSFMFTGDASTTVENDFLKSLTNEERQRFENVSVFQAGHHGSSTSNGQKLLDLITPEYTVASAGENNKYGHPSQDFQDRLEGLTHANSDYLLITYKLGDIVFGIKDGTLVYFARQAGEGVTIRWYYIAAGIFVIGAIVIISVKVTKNKEATAKRVIAKTKQVSRRLK